MFLILLCTFSPFKYIGRLKLWKLPGLPELQEADLQRGQWGYTSGGLPATRDDHWNLPAWVSGETREKFPN